MAIAQDDMAALSTSPRATALGAVSPQTVASAEQAVGRRFPDLVRWWIGDLGAVNIARPAPGRPYLLLLGLGAATTIDDNIVLFNDRNPTLPQDYLVFAREFDGEIDHVYAVDRDGVVHKTGGFLFPMVQYSTAYTSTTWQREFADIQSFWDSKVRFYLER